VAGQDPEPARYGAAKLAGAFAEGEPHLCLTPVAFPCLDAPPALPMLAPSVTAVSAPLASPKAFPTL
jgi:hypothetical protein